MSLLVLRLVNFKMMHLTAQGNDSMESLSVSGNQFSRKQQGRQLQGVGGKTQGIRKPWLQHVTKDTFLCSQLHFFHQTAEK